MHCETLKHIILNKNVNTFIRFFQVINSLLNKHLITYWRIIQTERKAVKLENMNVVQIIQAVVGLLFFKSVVSVLTPLLKALTVPRYQIGPKTKHVHSLFRFPDRKCLLVVQPHAHFPRCYCSRFHALWERVD